MSTRLFQHGVAWGNPYTEPPGGLPRQLLSVSSDSHRPDPITQRKIDAVIDRLCARDIWGYYQTHDCSSSEPTRQWSEEAKKRNRLKRLRNRLSRKYSIPFLLEEAIEKAVSEKPDYYL